MKTDKLSMWCDHFEGMEGYHLKTNLKMGYKKQ